MKRSRGVRRTGGGREKDSAIFRKMFDLSPVGLVILGEDGSFLHANSAAASQLGYTKKEFLRLGIPDIDAVMSREQIRRYIDEALRGKKLRFETLQRRKDGTLRAVHVSVNKGVFRGRPAFFSAWRDVTRESRLRRSLEKQAGLQKATLDSITDAVFVLDEQTPPRIVDCNRSAVRMFGRSRKAMIGLDTAFLHVAEATLRQFARKIQAGARRGTRPIHVPEHWMRRKDGSIFPSEHFVSALHSGSGARVGWVSVVRDITARRKSERALREGEQKLTAMLRSIPDHVCMMDRKLNLVWANDAAKRSFGGDLVGRKCYEVFYGAHGTKVWVEKAL